MIIEGPLNQQRSLAVIEEVKKTFPNEPIRYPVNTHNHFDHLGRVPTYVAEAATVIADDRNRDFYQRVMLAPQQRTLQFDRCRKGRYTHGSRGPGAADVHGSVHDQRWE